MNRNGLAAYLLPVVLYCILIFFISSLPSPPAPSYGLDFGDKVNHIGAYGIMMLLAFRASRWIFRDRSLAWQVTFALAFVLLYGASDEFHQALVPNRECDLFDWFADALGGILGALFILPTHRAHYLRFLYGQPLPDLPDGGSVAS